mgnify:FL=1
MAKPLLFTAERKAMFLERFEETCSVKDAAAWAGVSPKTANHHKKLDPQFAKDWDEARERALDDLLGEAHRRATVEKSDRLLEVLLKFRYGDQMADRLAVKVQAQVGLDPTALLAMPDDDRVALQALLGKYVEAEESLRLEHEGGEG